MVLLSQGQALLKALGSGLTPREQLLVPPGFCRARSQHHKGRTQRFASVKGTSSHISNVGVLKPFTATGGFSPFFLVVLSTVFDSTVLFGRGQVHGAQSSGG